jgi:adenosylcobinamide-GDP ribazoletransferase
MDMDCLTDCARHMWAFPLVGAFLGLVAGVFGWVVGFVLPSLVVGALALAVLLLLTGLHHTDGLLDFGDAVMVHGTPERKIEVMHDQLTGSGAIGLSIMTYLVSAFAFVSVAGSGSRPLALLFGNVSLPLVITGLITAELCAKLAMVAATWAGKAVHKGMNSPFMDAMHSPSGNARLAAAVAVSLLVAVPLLGWAGLATVLAALLAGLAMVAIAHRHFGGVTGDVLGATNELTRMVCVCGVVGGSLMMVTALIMAGGKGTRLQINEEKPLLPVGEKTVIELVLAALKKAKRVDDTVVAISRNTPKTAACLQQRAVKTIETPGKEYVSDMDYAIKKLGLETVLAIGADLPLLTGEVVDDIVARYFEVGKSTLAVAVPQQTAQARYRCWLRV